MKFEDTQIIFKRQTHVTDTIIKAHMSGMLSQI